MTGIIQADICKMELGKGNPTLATVQKIAKALGTTASALLS